MIKSKLSKNSIAFIELLSELTDRDRYILIERFKKNKSLKKVASNLDVSDITVREIENNLIKNIDQMYEFINI